MVEEISERKKAPSALVWRVTTSVLLIPTLVGLFAWDHSIGATAPILLAFCVLLAWRATFECVQLIQSRQFAPSVTATSLGSLVIVVSGWWGNALFDASHRTGIDGITFALAIVVLILFARAAFRYQSPGGNLETLGAEVFIVIYVGFLLALTSQLRWVAGASAGYLALGSLLISTKSGDIGAYTLGRCFGRRKMSPRLSPGKTWMGAVGALLGATLGSMAWFHWATPHFDSQWRPCAWYWAGLFGVIMGLIGLIGDLCESLIKRDMEQKDSASVLPGFGGILDLIDSVLYAGPVAYVLWRLLPLATWLSD